MTIQLELWTKAPLQITTSLIDTALSLPIVFDCVSFPTNPSLSSETSAGRIAPVVKEPQGSPTLDQNPPAVDPEVLNH